MESTYGAFGLVFSSDIPLPELEPATGAADVCIRRAPLATVSEEDGCIEAGTEHFLFQWREAGRFLVSRGEILVDAGPDAPPETLRKFLLGPVIAAAVHQQGYLVFHGSATRVGEAAVLFFGDSGKGKSTTVAGLLARGHALLADDIVAVRMGDAPMVVPAFPEINLWNRVAEAVSFEGTAVRAEAGRDKQAYRVEQRFAREEAPLVGVYYLDVAGSVGVEPLAAGEALTRLFDNSFGPQLLRSGSHAGTFGKCAALAGRVASRRLLRTADLAELPALLELVENDVTDLARKGADLPGK